MPETTIPNDQTRGIARRILIEVHYWASLIERTEAEHHVEDPPEVDIHGRWARIDAYLHSTQLVMDRVVAIDHPAEFLRTAVGGRPAGELEPLEYAELVLVALEGLGR